MIRDMQDSDLREVALNDPAVAFLPHHRSIVIDDKVVAIYGYQTVCPGVGQCWIAVNPRSARYPLAIIRAGRELSRIAIRKFDLHRLQTAVLARDSGMNRMMALLGFTAECVLEKASADGSDVVMYRMFKGE